MAEAGENGPRNGRPTTIQFTQETPDQRSIMTTRLTRMTAGKSRRYTPYARTPATRNLRSVKPPATVSQRGLRTRTPPGGTSKQTSPTADTNNIKELVGKTWRVFRLSPLFKFSHNLSDLRQYSRVLSAYLYAETHKGLAVETTENRVNSATFTVMKNLRRTNGEADAIQIQLKQKKTRGAGEACVVAIAILCSVGADEEAIQEVTSQFTLLPIMLYKGPVMLSRIFTQWLQSQFDCAIHPVLFTPVCMSWMIAMWASSTLKGHRVELQYKVPVDGLDHITMDIDPHDCRRLWLCIHTSTDESFHHHEVVTFIKSLEQHFYRHFKINIGGMPLCRVGTSIACVGAEGRLKIYSEDYVHQVLGHVTEVVMETNGFILK